MSRPKTPTETRAATMAAEFARLRSNPTAAERADDAAFRARLDAQMRRASSPEVIDTPTTW